MNQEKLNSKLLEATKKGDFDKIWKLVERGADVNAQDQWGMTALMGAAYKGHLTPELLETFISHGANINVQDQWGRTALIWSAYNGYLTPELLEAFVQHGADVNARDEYGITALMVSAGNGHLTPRLLDFFMTYGADVNASDEYGITALMYSAWYGHLTPELLKTFISHGANLEEAYEYLKENNASAMVRSILLFFSCGYSIRDMYDGWTPENFLKWLDYNAKNLKAGARAAYVMMANMSLYPERSAVPPSTKWTEMHFVVFDEILYGRNAGAGLNMVLETFSSMNESVWLPFVPSLLGTMAGDRKKPLNVKAENAPLMVRILLHCLETEPGTALEFVKQRIGKKNLETWVNHGVEGANTLVSRLVPYLKKEENTVRDVPLDATITGFF